MAFDGTKPADNQTIAAGPADIRENQRALKEDKIVNAQKLMDLSPGNASGNISVANGTLCKNLNAEKLGGNLAGAFATAGHTHGAATTSSNGLMCNTDKAKLDGIAAGAEVNRNAFSNILVGTTLIQADGKTDTLELAAGANLSLTPDVTNDRVTMAVSGTIPNADTVDGVHADTLLRKLSIPPSGDINDFGDLNAFFTHDTGMGAVMNTPQGDLEKGSAQVFVVENYGYSSTRMMQRFSFIYPLDAVQVYVRNQVNGKWGAWRQIAAVDGTVANANALGNLDVGQFVHTFGEATGDWDHYRQPGMYMVNEWTDKTNCPSDAYPWGTLVVFRGYDDDFHGVGQLYLSHGGSQIFYRGGFGSGRWDVWKQIVTTEGNAATASKLQTARTIALTGEITGSATFDGAANVNIAANVTNATLAFSLTYPDDNAQTPRYIFKKAKTLKSVQVYCVTAPTAATTIAVYQNGVSVASLAVSGINTIHTPASTVSFVSGDIVHAAISGSANSLDLVTIELVVS